MHMQGNISESLDGSGSSKEVRAVNRASDDIYDHSYDITLVYNFVVVDLQMYLPAYYSRFRGGGGSPGAPPLLKLSK